MNSGQQSASDLSPTLPLRFSMRRIRIGLALTLLGFLAFLVGARPDAFMLDRSPVIGFIQTAVFVVGLAIMAVGGFISIMALWKDQHISIAGDLGQRMVATGFVVAVFAGMADVFGFGSHIFPDLPYFGVWQARGVVFAEVLMGIGFLMMLPFGPTQRRDAAPPDKPAVAKPTDSSIS
jgi:hypothetical protein